MWHIEHTICFILPFQIVRNVKKPAKTETGLCSDVLFRRILIMPRNITRIKQSISCFLSFRLFESLINASLWYIWHIPHSCLHFALRNTPFFWTENPHDFNTYLLSCLEVKRQTNGDIFRTWSLISYTYLQLCRVLNQTAAVCAYDVPGDKNYRLQNITYDAQLKT